MSTLRVLLNAAPRAGRAEPWALFDDDETVLQSGRGSAGRLAGRATQGSGTCGGVRADCGAAPAPDARTASRAAACLCARGSAGRPRRRAAHRRIAAARRRCGRSYRRKPRTWSPNLLLISIASSPSRRLRRARWHNVGAGTRRGQAEDSSADTTVRHLPPANTTAHLRSCCSHWTTRRTTTAFRSPSRLPLSPTSELRPTSPTRGLSLVPIAAWRWDALRPRGIRAGNGPAPR